MAIPSWYLVNVYGTWVDNHGTKLAGNYRISVPVRLTNSADDLIIPADVPTNGLLFATGPLNTSTGPSLAVLCPATDDPDIEQTGWRLQVEITFTDGRPGEQYLINVPIADRPAPQGGTGLGVNLRRVALPMALPYQAATYGVGRPRGLALLDATGTHVVDADGNPILGGSGPGGGGNTYTILSATAARTNPATGDPLPPGASVIWICPTEPTNLDPARDIWLTF